MSDREAIAVVNAYKIENGKVVQIEQKLTPGQSDARTPSTPTGWAQSIWARHPWLRRGPGGARCMLDARRDARRARLCSPGRRRPGRSTRPGYAKAMTCSACHGVRRQQPVGDDADPGRHDRPRTSRRRSRTTRPASGRRRRWSRSPRGEAPRRRRDRGATSPRSGASRRRSSVDRGGRRARPRGRRRSARRCHGAGGQGRSAPSSCPTIAGQPPGYLRNQMLLFKADKRSPGDEQLNAAEGRHEDRSPTSTLADLAAYYSSLR